PSSSWRRRIYAKFSRFLRTAGAAKPYQTSTKRTGTDDFRARRPSGPLRRQSPLRGLSPDDGPQNRSRIVGDLAERSGRDLDGLHRARSRGAWSSRSEIPLAGRPKHVASEFGCDRYSPLRGSSVRHPVPSRDPHTPAASASNVSSTSPLGSPCASI